mmetsp:Transcript_4074/g.7296  ORF Transcript_4074/g.7296 Transcript_4074/m.7296 type:complete len:139 (-) Transcript_4074:72-488(-)
MPYVPPQPTRTPKCPRKEGVSCLYSSPDRTSSSTTTHHYSFGGSVVVHFWGPCSFSNQWFEKCFDAGSNRQAYWGQFVDAFETIVATSVLKPALLVHHEDPPFALVVATKTTSFSSSLIYVTDIISMEARCAYSLQYT